MRLFLFLLKGGDTMKRMIKTLSMVLIALFAVSVLAQTRPDFSGRWTSEPERALLSGTLEDLIRM